MGSHWLKKLLWGGEYDFLCEKGHKFINLSSISNLKEPSYG